MTQQVALTVLAKQIYFGPLFMYASSVSEN